MQLQSLFALFLLTLGLASAAAINRKSLSQTNTLQEREDPSTHITTTIEADEKKKEAAQMKMKARHVAAFKGKGRRGVKRRLVKGGRYGGDITDGEDSADEGDGDGGRGNGSDTTDGEDSADDA